MGNRRWEGVSVPVQSEKLGRNWNRVIKHDSSGTTASLAAMATSFASLVVLLAIVVRTWVSLPHPPQIFPVWTTLKLQGLGHYSNEPALDSNGAKNVPALRSPNIVRIAMHIFAISFVVIMKVREQMWEV